MDKIITLEVYEKDNMYYCKDKNEVEWYIGSKNIIDDINITKDTQYIPTTVKVTNTLNPTDIVELSKAGVKPDEIIRLREKGLL